MSIAGDNYKSTESFMKGFIENAKVQFNDDKWIELPRSGDNHNKIELQRNSNPRCEGTSF